MAGQLEMSLRLILYARSFLLWSSDKNQLENNLNYFQKSRPVIKHLFWSDDYLFSLLVCKMTSPGSAAEVSTKLSSAIS